MNDEEKIKKAATFIDSFLVRTNTNLKKYAASKDLPEKESVIEILEGQKRVIEKIKEILTYAGIFSSKLNSFSTKYSTLVFLNSFALNRILYSSTSICF